MPLAALQPSTAACLAVARQAVRLLMRDAQNMLAAACWSTARVGSWLRSCEGAAAEREEGDTARGAQRVAGLQDVRHRPLRQRTAEMAEDSR